MREGNVFEVKATGGDIFLGGLDFDNALIRSVLCDFVEKHAIDLAEDPVAMQRIRDMAERVKIDLSSRDSAMFNIPFVALDASGMPLNIELNLTRDWLNELVSPLIDHSLEIVERVLTDSGLRPNEIDEVLLMLILLGIGQLKDFAIAMILGVLVGTYSSIFIAIPLSLLLENVGKKPAPKALSTGRHRDGQRPDVRHGRR